MRYVNGRKFRFQCVQLAALGWIPKFLVPEYNVRLASPRAMAPPMFPAPMIATFISFKFEFFIRKVIIKNESWLYNGIYFGIQFTEIDKFCCYKKKVLIYSPFIVASTSLLVLQY